MLLCPLPMHEAVAWNPAREKEEGWKVAKDMRLANGHVC